jgi:sugar phosphate isomerase/epimerase
LAGGGGDQQGRATAEEIRQQEIDALKRALDGVEFRLYELSTLSDQSSTAERRRELKSERRYVQRRLKGLEAKEGE